MSDVASSVAEPFRDSLLGLRCLPPADVDGASSSAPDSACTASESSTGSASLASANFRFSASVALSTTDVDVDSADSVSAVSETRSSSAGTVAVETSVSSGSLASAGESVSSGTSVTCSWAGGRRKYLTNRSISRTASQSGTWPVICSAAPRFANAVTASHSVVVLTPLGSAVSESHTDRMGSAGSSLTVCRDHGVSTPLTGVRTSGKV